MTKSCSLPTVTDNETIGNFTQYELAQEESDLLKTGLHFSIHRHGRLVYEFKLKMPMKVLVAVKKHLILVIIRRSQNTATVQTNLLLEK